ncbi:terminase large subunit domain-containing protein [Novosphingopyxis sp.]|uniref:terminase large subunit domain-containing protein n=1 Tax=Novosphingopyxis sp. TaxID=2709690 RepID=UPI003B5C5B2E
MTGGRSEALAQFISLDEPGQRMVLGRMPPHFKLELSERWHGFEHGGQRMPGGDWRVWLIRAGRGFGKTRAGAEWVSEFARLNPDAHIALVGATSEDARRVMVEGRSGLLNVARSWERPRWKKGAGEVHFPSGAVATVYSSETPDVLRGPEHHAAWCDELAKWRQAKPAWDNLIFGLRLGSNPRAVVTTTPRSVPIMRQVMAMKRFVETRGATRDNPHLDGDVIADLEAEYGASNFGRQELSGELIDDVEGALWGRALLEARRCAVPEVKDRRRVVVGVDPPAGAGAGDACGIVVAALTGPDRAVVLADCSVAGEGPAGWARAVARAAREWGADRVIAEVNQGGAMVENVLRAADAVLPVKRVHASRSKTERAEPVATLYETDKVRHAGCFPELEDQLCGLLVNGGYAGPGRSPDRADAAVWALGELLLGPRRATARVRWL